MYMPHGSVMDMPIVPMLVMKPTVNLKAVPMVNMTVVPIVVHMVSVFMVPGPVMVQKTVMMAQMKPIVVLHHVKIKV